MNMLREGIGRMMINNLVSVSGRDPSCLTQPFLQINPNSPRRIP